MHSPSGLRLLRPAACAAVLSLASNALADGYRNPPPGPALGRSGNATAWVDDPTAILYNPANLADAREAASLISLSLARTRIDWSLPGGPSASSRSEWQALPNAFVAWPIENSPWTAGVGLTTPFGQSVEWPKDNPFRYESPYFAQIAMLNLTPAAARRISPAVAMGAGLDLYLSAIEFKQRVPWGRLPVFPAIPDGEIRATGEGAALGGRIGATWDFAPHHRLAVSYRSRFRVNYDGDFRARGLPAPLDAGTRDFSTRVRYPDILAAGYGVRLTETWRAEIQVERLLGSVNKEQPVDVEAPYDALVPARIPNRWEDTWTFGAGTDWEFSPGWTLRAGYTYMESPVPDETVSPLLPDSDRHTFAAGLGRRFGAHSLDLAVTWNRLQKRDTPTGRYEYKADLVGVSYAVRF